MKAGFPYLVDIGITTKCPTGCSFCYTSSVKTGTHADFQKLVYLAEVLYNSNVFEVVLGGGEPILHPDIEEICRVFKSLNFKTGITTKQYNLYKIKNIKDILQNVSSLCFSCHNINDLTKTKNCLDELEKNKICFWQRPRIYVQNILGLTNYHELKDFLETAKELKLYNVTLLGYKNFGFGMTQKQYDIPDEWVDFVSNLDINIGIDSILAKKYKHLLIQKGIKEHFLVGEEGETTCYIDAVNWLLKKSSFCSESKELFFDPSFTPESSAEYFIEEFSKL